MGKLVVQDFSNFGKYIAKNVTKLPLEICIASVRNRFYFTYMYKFHSKFVMIGQLYCSTLIIVYFVLSLSGFPKCNAQHQTSNLCKGLKGHADTGTLNQKTYRLICPGNNTVANDQPNPPADSVKINHGTTFPIKEQNLHQTVANAELKKRMMKEGKWNDRYMAVTPEEAAWNFDDLTASVYFKKAEPLTCNSECVAKTEKVKNLFKKKGHRFPIYSKTYRHFTIPTTTTMSPTVIVQDHSVPVSLPTRIGYNNSRGTTQFSTDNVYWTLSANSGGHSTTTATKHFSAEPWPSTDKQSPPPQTDTETTRNRVPTEPPTVTEPEPIGKSMLSGILSAVNSIPAVGQIGQNTPSVTRSDKSFSTHASPPLKGPTDESGEFEYVTEHVIMLEASSRDHRDGSRGSSSSAETDNGRKTSNKSNASKRSGRRRQQKNQNHQKRRRRDSTQPNSLEPILGQRFVLYCSKTASEELAGYHTLCGTCRALRTLPEEYFPRYLNEVSCYRTQCFGGGGNCVEKFVNLDILHNIGLRDRPHWVNYTVSLVSCCDCAMSSQLANLLQVQTYVGNG